MRYLPQEFTEYTPSNLVFPAGAFTKTGSGINPGQKKHLDIILLDAKMYRMRTTLTLEPDVAQLVKRSMTERGTTLKETINELIRKGFAQSKGKKSENFQQKTCSMGTPLMNLDRALDLSGSLEEQEILRKLELKK